MIISCLLLTSSSSFCPSLFPSFFFFNDPATTEIYTLSLHDALPISSFPPCSARSGFSPRSRPRPHCSTRMSCRGLEDRKSTRLNSSHLGISYAVFCLKKKKKKKTLVHNNKQQE